MVPVVNIRPMRDLTLMVATMKLLGFLDTEKCSLVDPVVRPSSIIRAMIVEAVRTSETSVCFNETALRYIPENYFPQISHTQIFTILYFTLQ
jgi:hypothetical protein